jgi:DNA-binding HxlR family transcriptional regulator
VRCGSGREGALGQESVQGGGDEEGPFSQGRRLAGHMPANRQWTPIGRALTITGDNWTLVIALQLALGGMRLSQLREQLAGVSAGVLDRYVRQMATAGLVTRTRFREMPPRVEIELTEAGRELLPIAGALARWGLRRAWTPPERGERVDLDALLRLLPVLLEEEAGLPNGILEVRMTGPDEPVRHRFAVRDGHLEALPESSDSEPTVTVSGDLDAWMAAFSPNGEQKRLDVSGDETLAQRMLAGLPRPL